MIQIKIMTKAWKKARKNIFRMETLPEYHVPSDTLLFEQWKKGELKPNEDEAWFKQLKETKAKKIKMQRVRIVPLPLPEYIRYEIDYWKTSQKCGEKFLFLKSEDYQKIISTLNFNPEDFWMFDNKVLVIFHYKNGDLDSKELIGDKEIINQYVNLKRTLIKKSTPMKEFLEKYQT